MVPHLPEDEAPCPVETVVRMLSNKWRVLIVRNLLHGPCRFNELRKNIRGVSQGVLTSNLREMESLGLVSRRVFAEIPPHVEYSLTPLGRSMEPILNSMADWGEAYLEQHPIPD